MNFSNFTASKVDFKFLADVSYLFRFLISKKVLLYYNLMIDLLWRG